MTRHNMDSPKVALPTLWDDAAHCVSESALARCAEMQREAADAEDYETASILKQLVTVLRPQPPRSALDCSPAGAAAKAQVCTIHRWSYCAERISRRLFSLGLDARVGAVFL